MRTHGGGGQWWVRAAPQAQRRGARPGARQTCWKRVKGGTHRGDYVQPSVRRGGCRTAWLISPGSMMDEPWHMPKSCCCRCYCCWHNSELAKVTHSFVFCLLPFPLSFFLSFHSVCHSINPNSSLFFLSLLLVLSLTECCCGSACSTICDKKSSETMQTESWREPIQGWHLSHSLPPNPAVIFPLPPSPFLLLLPLSDNTPHPDVHAFVMCKRARHVDALKDSTEVLMTVRGSCVHASAWGEISEWLRSLAVIRLALNKQDEKWA